ncbi:MAG TPA: DUF6748 domain-containing protein [Kofleriaceae bacterium]
MLCALAGCASGVAGDPADDPALEARSTDAYTYFAITADLRKCASPVCGGWFLSRVNQTTTQCHDGSIAASCYTPVLDWSKSGLTDDQQATMLEACSQGALSSSVYAVVRGQFARRNTTTPRRDLGRFVISEAWLAEGDAMSGGAFVKLRDNGLRCFVAPCPSITELTLNMATTTNIAGLDWTPSAMTDDQIAECNGDLFMPDGLLVVGNRYTMTENGTTADGRTVTVAYQRLLPQ